MKILENENLRMEIDPEYCFVERAFYMEKQIIKESVDGHKTHGGIAPLFPYANRIKSGKYKWEDKEFQFVTDSSGNSIHGYAKDRKWEIVAETDRIIEMKVNLYDTAYPFNIECNVEIGLKEDSFYERSLFKNKGKEKAPLSPGFHPYFMTGNSWQIEFKDKPYKVLKKDTFFPSGNYVQYYRKMWKRRNHTYDDCFKYSGDVHITGDFYEFHMKNENANFIMIYDGELSQGRSVAVEPMSSAIDSFNNMELLKVINPGETWPFGYSVSISLPFFNSSSV